MISDRRSQRATPRARFGLRREAITRKHAYMHDDVLIPDPHIKENVKQLAARPINSRIGAIKPTEKRASTLPATATWGMKAKAQRLARHAAEWSSKRDREILNESGSTETLPSKARLPSKRGGLYESAERNDKIKQRSLRRKYWVKSAKARREARAEYELALEELARVGNGGDDDGGGGGEGGVAAGEVKAPRARPSPYWAKRQEKKRREERRAARDRKCFDPVELDLPADVAPAAQKKSGQKKRGQKKAGPLLLSPEMLTPLTPGLLRCLLSSESTGPPVSDLFSSGMVLSNEAVKDLQLMLAGQGAGQAARALAQAASAPALKIRSAKDPRGRSPSRAKMGKVPPPSKAYPKKPAFDGERGKRRC